MLDDGRRELGTCLENDAPSEAFRKQYGPSIPRSKRRKTRHSKGMDEAIDVATNPAQVWERLASPASERLPPDLKATELEAVQSDILGATDLENSHSDNVSKEVTCTDLETTHAASTVPDVMVPEIAESESRDPGAMNSPPAIPFSAFESPSERPTQIHPAKDVDPPAPPLDPPALSRHFYLHLTRPAIPSSRPTLLPLSPSSTLAIALRSRVVREYPTIYVLNHQAEAFPSGRFTLESDVGVQLEKEIQGMLDGGKRGSRRELGDDSKEEGEVEDVSGCTNDVKMEMSVAEEPGRRTQSQLGDLRYIQQSFI